MYTMNPFHLSCSCLIGKSSFIVSSLLATASRQLPPGQLPPGQVPPGQVPLWTSSTSDKFPPDKFPFGQLSPGQVPLPGKHLKRTSSPRTTSPRTSSPTDNFPPDKFPWGDLSHFSSEHMTNNAIESYNNEFYTLLGRRAHPNPYFFASTIKKALDINKWIGSTREIG